MSLRKIFLVAVLTVLSVGLMSAGVKSGLEVDAVYSTHSLDIVAAQPSGARAIVNPPSTEATLYSNGPLVTHPGGGFGGADASALQTALLMGIYGFGHQGTLNYSVADDFTVTDAGGWTVDELCFYAYQTGSSTTSTFTQVDWTIWDGDPSIGGASVVCSGSATVGGGTLSSTWSGIYRTLDTDIPTANTRPIMVNTVTTGGCVLAAGTYWVEWKSWGSLASGPWCPPVTVLGSTGTGNGSQNQAGVWVDLIDVGPQDVPFEVKGSVNGGGGVSCGDIFFFNAKCNMNGAAQSMVKMSGDFTGQTVTFDLDGDDYIINVLSNGTNSIAKLTVPHAGMGAHTITLQSPSGCYSPVNFNCQVNSSRPDPEWDAIEAEYLTMQEAAMAKVGKTPMTYAVSNERHIVRPAIESAVLVDQTDAPGTNSYTSQDFEASFDIYDNQGADDFTVPGGSTWNVNQVIALGVYYNGVGPMPTANVYFYNDNAGFPGTLITSVSVAPTSDVGGTITCDFPDVVLGAGTYWVSVQARMDFGAGGQWGWTGNATPNGNGAAWQNPGNGFATGCTVWGREATCILATEPDKAYILSGTVGGGGISCGDIFFFNAKCNMNGAAQAMVKASGDFTGSTVTFDLDGDDYTINVMSNGTNSIAKLTVPHAGMGAHTITLQDPSGCYSPVNFNCQVDSRPDPEWDAMMAEYEAMAQASALKVIPTETRIIGNYPNPFNPSTTIRYALSVDSPVSVRVYNMLGQEVATLVDGFQKAGEQSVTWHGTNNFGQSVASGLYIYRLQAGNSVMTQKMLFTK